MFNTNLGSIFPENIVKDKTSETRKRENEKNKEEEQEGKTHPCSKTTQKEKEGQEQQRKKQKTSNQTQRTIEPGPTRHQTRHDTLTVRNAEFSYRR